jgi:hypothetical protein
MYSKRPTQHSVQRNEMHWSVTIRASVKATSGEQGGGGPEVQIYRRTQMEMFSYASGILTNLARDSHFEGMLIA